jgi:hypothetical protein
VNGEMVASATDGTGSVSNELDLHLGNNSKLDASLYGALDEVKLFNYALSEAEVKEIYGATDIEITNETVPNEFVLSQNYPNPFNPTTQIDFSCPKRSKVKLEIFDITGRRITTLIDGVIDTGSHSINFDGSNFTSGIYVYKLTASNVILTRKMLLIK